MSTLFVTGVDSAGLSSVRERRDVTAGMPPLPVAYTEDSIPTVQSSSSKAAILESHAEAGAFRFTIHARAPGDYTDVHRTISVDFDVVLHGSVELILETETVVMELGDCAYLPGVVHSWRAGSEGVVMAYSILAAAVPDEDTAKPRTPSARVIHRAATVSTDEV